MQKEKSTFSLIFSFAGQKKARFAASVFLAAVGAVFQMLPYFVMADIIGKLLSGDRDMNGYLADCGIMAAMWLLRVTFHSLSTSQPHQGAFDVLGNIRRQGLEKLSRMPLGDVRARGSGELKNILAERVDSMEPTLAHVIPEMTANAFAALASLVYLFVLDRRMALLSLGIMLVSVIGTSLLKYNATALQTEAGYSTAANKRVSIAEHLRYLPMGYFSENSLGTITSVTTNTMENLSGVATRVVMTVTEGIFSTAVMTLAVFVFDLRVGIFIAAGLFIYYLINKAMQSASEKTTAKKTAADTVTVDKVIEYIKGIAEVKAYRLTGKYNHSLENAIEDNVSANIGMELKLLPLMLAQNAAAKLTDVGVVLLSLKLYTSGNMELFDCVMMCICSFMITEGLEQAGTQSSLLRVADTCVTKANEILDLPAMDISGEEYTPKHFDLSAEDITFSYEKKKIIDNISLDIPEKTTTAIVGPSGGGKTTLCHLLSRFWDADSGRVTLDGKDVREYSRTVL